MMFSCLNNGHNQLKCRLWRLAIEIQRLQGRAQVLYPFVHRLGPHRSLAVILAW